MKPVLTHLALGVRDLERTIDFYRRHVGLHVVHDRHDGEVRVVWLSERAEEPDFVLVLFEIHHDPPPAPSTLQHLGFAVDRAHVGRLVELDLPSGDEVEARAQVERMCEQLLANPLIESYEIELETDDVDAARVEVERMCEQLLANPQIETFEISLQEISSSEEESG